MQIRMQNAERLTPEPIREFLQGSQSIEFVGRIGLSDTSLCSV